MPTTALVLERLLLDPDVTIGCLKLDGLFQCWTLEDVVRPDAAPKVPGQTAIPYGSYPVTITFSNRFQRPLPLLGDVPGFSGVRIHPGNTAADTEGCVLVGADRLPKSIGRSRMAFDALFPVLQKAVARGPVVLQVVRG